MPNRKYSDDSALASWNDADTISILDVSDTTDGGSGTSKKTTYAQLKTMLQTVDGDVTYDGAYHPIIDPGSDVDAVLLEVTVTGTPQIKWDESESAIDFNKPIIVTSSAMIGATGLVGADTGYFQVLGAVATRAASNLQQSVIALGSRRGTNAIQYTGAIASRNEGSAIGGLDILVNDFSGGVSGADLAVRISANKAARFYGAFSIAGVATQAQQAHIVNADGQLADITTKFNTLLADLEGFGFHATS